MTQEEIKEPNYPIAHDINDVNIITTADFKRWVVEVTNRLNNLSTESKEK